MSNVTQTTREPQFPDFAKQASVLLYTLPVFLNSKDYPNVLSLIAQSLQLHFTLGLQEAKERIKHDQHIL